MKASWEPAPGSVLQYRVAYRPSVGGPRKEVSVKGDTKVALLKNLEPGTQYDVAVTAQYSSGPGGALEGRGSTLEGKPATFLIYLLLFEKEKHQLHSADEGQSDLIPSYALVLVSTSCWFIHDYHVCVVTQQPRLMFEVFSGTDWD